MATIIAQQEIESLEKNIVHIQHDLEEMNKRITLLKHTSITRRKKAIPGDHKLISLVGTQPIRSLQEDKVFIREAIVQRYTQ